MRLIHWSIFIILPLLLIAAKPDNTAQNFLAQETQKLAEILKRSDAQQYDFQVVQIYPHDTQAFTEGLVWDQDELYESTGLYGQSSLRKVAKISGDARNYPLAPQYFGEGIAILGQDLYQLTYREKTAFLYDKNTCQIKKTFSYPTEGWGLTAANHELIMSDGTPTLRFLDPNTFTVLRQIEAHTNLQKLPFINELEYINGKIFANVWPTNIIVILSPTTGKIEAWVNINSLNLCSSIECVANGIAFDKTTNTLLVTGKYWQHLYGIKIPKLKNS